MDKNVDIGQLSLISTIGPGSGFLADTPVLHN